MRQDLNTVEKSFNNNNNHKNNNKKKKEEEKEEEERQLEKKFSIFRRLEMHLHGIM